MDFRETLHSGTSDADSKLADIIQKLSTDMMKSALPDRPEIQEKLTPNYPPGCKRVIISDDYFPALARDNVTLNTGGIERVTEKGIVTDGNEEEFDLIILATGFRTVEFMHPIKVTGKDNRLLSDIWKDGACALYGVGVESLPNFGMLYGPNTNLGHNSIVLMIEAEVRYTSKLISAVLSARQQGESLTITPKSERVAEYNKELHEALSKTSFAHPNCNSWYKNDKGLITNNWSGDVVEYQKILATVNWNDFDLVGYGAEQLEKKKTTRVGRVMEESIISYKTLGISMVSMAAIAGGLAITGTPKRLEPMLQQMLSKWRWR